MESNPTLVDLSKLPKIPNEIYCKFGNRLTYNESNIVIDYTTRKYSFDFYTVESKYLRYTVELYLSYLLTTTSIPHSYNTYAYLKKIFKNTVFELGDDSEILEKEIIKHISDYKNTHEEYRVWYLKSWYVWCRKMSLPHFNDSLADSFENMKISGNTKGHAVLQMNEEGPLSSVEINELTTKLEQCSLEDDEFYTAKVMIWLSLVLGANSRNLILLKWKDLKAISDGENTIYLLSVPRIKKRVGDREEFKIRELDSRVAKVLLSYKEYTKNKLKTDKVEDYPLLSEDGTNAFRSYSANVSKYAIKIDLSFKLTIRRLRYTFATRLVMNGVSKEKLAELLDHSDLQHVQVYYDLREKIKDFLSEAESKELGAIFKRFKGKISKDSGDGDILYSYTQSPKKSVLGKCGSNELCSLNPPFSCIVCPKFNAFSDSLDVYKQMLSYLVNWSKDRKDIYGDNERIHSLMHDVQLALGDLIKRIESKEQA